MIAKANAAHETDVSISDLFESKPPVLHDLRGEDPNHRRCLLCHESFVAERADEKYCEICEGEYEMYRLPATD